MAYLVGAALTLFAAHATAVAPVALQVDASRVADRILRTTMQIPVSSGPMTLTYPKWIPGTGGASGDITYLTRLRLSAGGRSIPWARDSVDLYAFHCEIPNGVSSLRVELTYAPPLSASSSTELAAISWPTVLLYREGPPVDQISVVAALRLPHGWKWASALPVERQREDEVDFRPTSLATLVDSPVLVGAHLRTIPLSEGPVPHFLDVAADHEGTLEIPAARVAALRRLVAEAGALFGAPHYRDYHFLLALSDHLQPRGLEHAESSDLGYPERYLADLPSDPDALPHELAHSWEGKYRRPAGMTQPDFQQPLRFDLQWIYEGLANYLGMVLAARSGLLTASEFRDRVAQFAAVLGTRTGRAWRPMADLAVAGPLPSPSGFEGTSDRMQVHDVYVEGTLLWLEVDALIRQRTQGRHSLDDFCRSFFGGPPGLQAPRPYTLDDVIAALNEVAPNDWRSFFQARVFDVAPGAPVSGIVASGYRLAYRDTLSGALQHDAEAGSDNPFYLGVAFATGVGVQPDGTIIEVLPGTEADRVGLVAGEKIVGVGGQTYTRQSLHEAFKESMTSPKPMELLVDRLGSLETVRIDYHGMERYPFLERDGSKPDLLSQILAPRVSISKP